MAGLGAGPITGMMLADWGLGHTCRQAGPLPPKRIHVKDIDPHCNKRRLAWCQRARAFIPVKKEVIGYLMCCWSPSAWRDGLSGLAPEECMKQHPALVYARLICRGNRADGAKAGHDPNYVAATGALYHTGDPGSLPASPHVAGRCLCRCAISGWHSAGFVTVSKPARDRSSMRQSRIR